jgi:hypothetical protein
MVPAPDPASMLSTTALQALLRTVVPSLKAIVIPFLEQTRCCDQHRGLHEAVEKTFHEL